MPALMEPPVAKKKQDEKWMEGRDRPVRCVLTEEEHALVRQAAALSDLSVSKFAVESVVKAAKEIVGQKSKK